jgi:hypothetical protein
MSVKRAAKLYKAFRERTPRVAKEVRIKLPRAVAVMGYADFIGYTTTHRGGKALRYKHSWAKGSKPLLCAGPGKNQLFLIGGGFHVTERGIVDLTPRGREIED